MLPANIPANKNSPDSRILWNALKWAVLLILLISAALFFYHQKHKVHSLDIGYGSSLSGQYLASRFAVTHNDWAGAAVAVKSSLAEEPENLGLLITSLRLSLRLGNMDDAKNLADRIIKISAQEPIANTLLTAYYLKQGYTGKAEKLLQPLTLSPPDAKMADINAMVIRLLQIWTMVEEKNYKPALAKIDNLMAEGPPAFGQFLHYQAALIADVGGMPERAAAEYSAIIKSPAPKSYRFMEGAISFYRRSGQNPKEADRLYDSFMKKYLVLSENSTLVLKNEPIVNSGVQGAAELFAEVGSYLNENGLQNEAVEYLRMALYLRPDLPHIQYILADSLSNLGQEKAAIAIFEKINPDSPYNWRGRISIARDLQKIGAFHRARNMLLELDQERPGSPEAIVTLGDMYIKQERYSDAAKAYLEALDKIKNPEEKHWILFYSLGACYERMGQWDKAEKYLLKALELSPNQPEALNYLAYSWTERGENLGRAKEMLESAIRQDPEAGHILDSYGWVLFKLGDYKSAVENLEKAALMMPYDSTVNDHLGDAYWMVGRRNEAKFQWSTALDLHPPISEIVLLKRKLESGLDLESQSQKNSTTKEE